MQAAVQMGVITNCQLVIAFEADSEQYIGTDMPTDRVSE